MMVPLCLRLHFERLEYVNIYHLYCDYYGNLRNASRIVQYTDLWIFA
jgi:hypothetical protein